MADRSAIEWTEATWNPIVGCSILSPGCTNCYAMKMAARIERMGTAPHYAGTTQASKAGPVWTGKLALAPDITQPLRWKKPRTIFVNSMGDLFHEDVPDEWIDRVFAIMALCPQHTFQVLTKRSARMREYVSGFSCDGARRFNVAYAAGRIMEDGDNAHDYVANAAWPLPNVWLGVSAERQQEADERIPDLLATPAAIRFVSAEPLLGPIDFTRIDTGSGWVDALQSYICYPTIPEGHFRHEPIDWPSLDWIIVGGESGIGVRPMHPDWARSIRDQCAAAGVPFFFKQWGAWAPGKWSLDLDDRCHFHPFDPDVPVNGLGDHDRAQHRVHWWEDDKVPEGLGSLRVDKHRAGRLLDGVEHNGMPAPREVPFS